MTPQEFDAWAYGRLKVYLEDVAPDPADRDHAGVQRVKAFIAGIEGDRAVLVSE